MRTPTIAAALALSLVAATSSLAGPAEAAGPYVTVRDTDDLVGRDAASPAISSWRTRLLEQMAEVGMPIPEVLSVWTAFPMSGNNYATFIDPRANDVEGINLPLEESTTPPLRAVLWHNNLLALDIRSNLHRAPLEGYGRYLFLLELSHLWGPEMRVPTPNPSDLVGFPYHWSFFLDQPGPGGGNTWTDNRDGTFTVVPGDPATLGFSMLDLYVLGLAAPDEVEPFGVLIPTEVPTTPTDPFWGGPHSKRSFPWFDTENDPLTVTATRRELTVDDLIEANGERSPAAGEKTSWSIGFVLMVPGDATEGDVATAEAAMDELVPQLVDGFSEATQGRGSLEVLEGTPVGEGGGGGTTSSSVSGSGSTTSSSTAASSGSGGEGGEGRGDGADGETDEGCGCGAASGSPSSSAAALAAIVAAAIRRRGRREQARGR